MTTRRHHDAVGTVRPIPRAERRIVLVSAASIGLYIINYLLLRCFSDIGLPATLSIFHSDRATTRGLLLAQAAAYALVTALIFGGYAAILAMARIGQLASSRARWWALLVPCLINLLLIPCTPSLSQDVFSYMAHGFLGVLPGDNPFTQVATVARQTTIGPLLASYGWHTQAGITPYGVVWTQIEIAIMRISGLNIMLALVLFKTVAVAASFGTAYLIWSFLGRVNPTAQLSGTLAYLWNPLIIVEFAGEGHNDAVMLFFVFAALAGCAARRPIASTVAQLVAVLTKYVPIMFAPAQLVYLWNTRRGTAQLMKEILAALTVTAVLAALLYAPLWAGSQTFSGLLQRGVPLSSASPFGGINWILRKSTPAAIAGPLTIALVTLPVLCFVAWASLRVTDAASLARTFAWISIAYVLVASPDYWPWYACMPVALILTAEADRLLWLALTMSFVARLCAPLNLMRQFLSYQIGKGAITGLGATMPLIALLIWLYVQHRRRRLAPR